MVNPQILLQTPSKFSKIKDHIAALNRQMKLWTKGDLQELFDVWKAIQENFKKTIRHHKNFKTISNRNAKGKHRWCHKTPDKQHAKWHTSLK